MQKKFVVLSGIVFTGALAINVGPVWSQAGGSSGPAGSAPSGQKGSGTGSEMQKPTDPPAGTSRSKSGDSLGAAGQERSGAASGMQTDRARSGATGMSGQRSRDEVKQVQEALKDKGHDPGMVDGIMGPKTQQAIRAFQKKNNIDVTGRLDDKTASALGVESSAAGAAGAGAGSRSGAGAGRESDSETEKAGKSGSGAGSGASKSGAGASSSSGADKAGNAGKAGAAGQTPESRPGAMPGEKKAGQQ
jgi:peptidoglycan hydrolase-like protein with peptidoglycan-binding domain